MPRERSAPPLLFALALAEDLARWLRHEPIRARRTGLITRGRKWVRRNPSIAVMAAMLLVLAVPLGVMIWKTGSERSIFSNPAPPEKSIAVLPFSNLSKEQENAFFADGVQDEIVTDLAKVADLKVISRTSVMPYKSGMARNLRQIGQQLGVAHLVEGSVQRAAIVCVSTRSWSTPAPIGTYGPKLMTAIWRTCSPFRARSQRRLRISTG